jgi:hypothetical protein
MLRRKRNSLTSGSCTLWDEYESMVRFDGRSTLRWTRNSKTGSLTEVIDMGSYYVLMDEVRLDG